MEHLERNFNKRLAVSVCIDRNHAMSKNVFIGKRKDMKSLTSCICRQGLRSANEIIFEGKEKFPLFSINPVDTKCHDNVALAKRLTNGLYSIAKDITSIDKTDRYLSSVAGTLHPYIAEWRDEVTGLSVRAAMHIYTGETLDLYEGIECHDYYMINLSTECFSELVGMEFMLGADGGTSSYSIAISGDTFRNNLSGILSNLKDVLGLRTMQSKLDISHHFNKFVDTLIDNLDNNGTFRSFQLKDGKLKTGAFVAEQTGVDSFLPLGKLHITITGN